MRTSARVAAGIAALLLLSSCGENSPHRFTDGDYDRLDVADVNGRNAIARVYELEGRVEELEAQASDMQSRLDQLEASASY